MKKSPGSTNELDDDEYAALAMPLALRPDLCAVTYVLSRQQEKFLESTRVAIGAAFRAATPIAVGCWG
jgi:hypothetical protein